MYQFPENAPDVPKDLGTALWGGVISILKGQIL
jgi:hypothetical protein